VGFLGRFSPACLLRIVHHLWQLVTDTFKAHLPPSEVSIRPLLSVNRETFVPRLDESGIRLIRQSASSGFHQLLRRLVDLACHGYTAEFLTRTRDQEIVITRKQNGIGFAGFGLRSLINFDRERTAQRTK